MDDFDLEMDSHSPPITPAYNPAPLRPPSPRPSSKPSSSFTQSVSSSSSSSSVLPSSPASIPTTSGAVRFPSSFADFKLPTSPHQGGGIHGSFSYGSGAESTSSVPLGFGALLANGGGGGGGGSAGMDPNSLAAKRARRGSLLSLNNHYRGTAGDSAMVDSAIEQHRPTSPLSLSSSSATFQFGLASTSSYSSTTSSHATARPSTPPLSISSPWNSSLTRDGRPTSSSSSSSMMMISPQTSAKVLTRPSSPVALLNPPSFREVMSSPKRDGGSGGARFETGRIVGGVDQQLRDLEDQMELGGGGGGGGREGIVSRPITRTRNLKPQIKRTTTLLAAEAMPVDFYRAEASQEADWRRKTTSMPISPATLKIRSSLSGSTPSSSSAAAAANQHRLQAGRFPEDADVDDDIFANGMGGQSSGSSDDDDGMDDGNGTDGEGEGSVAGGSVTSTSIRERTSFGSLGNFGLGGGGGGHSSATPPPSFAVPVPATAGMFGGHRMSMEGGGGDASMVISSPVLGSAMTGMASPAGTPGGGGGMQGWRDSGKAGNKRKAADDRFEPYTKRRAVSPSTVLFPNSNSQPTNNTTASALPTHTSSSSSSSSSAGANPLASPIYGQPPSLPSSNLSTSTLPIPIISNTPSPYYATTSSRSRADSPVPPMAFSNGGNSSTAGGAGRSFGASSPFTGPGLGLSLLQREREGRRVVAAAMEMEEEGEGGGVLGRMRLE
ncbi:hypothetical protein BDY24DRAFT_386235 [Mrakia frigida]|uniref:uncharacterized protein n=1 Tax=Mrakia frigida TaxID=29902 RepID=UPI003FCBF5BF